MRYLLFNFLKKKYEDRNNTNKQGCYLVRARVKGIFYCRYLITIFPPHTVTNSITLLVIMLYLYCFLSYDLHEFFHP